MAVSINMVALRAAQISEKFRLKSRDAQHHSARRFVRSQGLVFCLRTNELQRSPAEVAAEAMGIFKMLHVQRCHHKKGAVMKTSF